ncbi:MAG: cytochrome c biogenesis protein CcsA [Planctomycetes bacterium]|jgi:ABC-type transport system involved in cytochrome c biogenesis permease subunit|nr:cytochrome c biogenesis protein CcsA [Planctomycetota bacterium]
MNLRPLSLLILALLSLLGACSRPAPRLQSTVELRAPWSADFVREFGALPLQQDGRVMPFSTLASFSLYAVHGRRDVQFVTSGPDGDRTVKLSPTEWLLDVWCFPDQAAHYPMFRIENVEVMSALGFQHGGQKQGFEYLSYAQLLPQGQKLTELADQYEGKPQNKRSEVEVQVLQLFRQLVVYHRLHQQLAALQSPIAVEGEALRTLFAAHLAGRRDAAKARGRSDEEIAADGDRIGLSTVMQQSEAFRALVGKLDPNGADFEKPEYGNLSRVLSHLTEAMEADRGAKLLPPAKPVGEADTWHTVPEVLNDAMRGKVDSRHVAMVTSLEAGLMAGSTADAERHLGSYLQAVAAAADQRGERGEVVLESYYYRANWHFHAMMTFLLAFVLGVVACVLPRNRLLWWATMLTASAALVMLTADVWMRCLITGHPPIARLYDTFLFIGGGGALTLLIAEAMLPRRIALVLATFVGTLFIFFARLFEVADAQDTMKPLQAVLLSNFWLGIHVPTMNMGYFSGVAAAFVAMAWIAVRVLRIDHPASTLAKSLARVTYGITCFSLATSVVGTILGGVWANDSWGRFWGWDPKENGALLICLSQIALLHARMTGMVRDAGFALWAVATGMIVVFSWFHTNLLGVGLHAYGFSSDLLTGVWVSYMVLGGFLLVGAADVWFRPDPAPTAPPLPTGELAAR